MIREESGKSKISTILIIFLLIILLAVGGTFIWYSNSIKATQKNSEKVVLEIESGSGVAGIADKLKSNGLIKNTTAFKVYCKLNKKTSMKAGKYELDKNMTVEQITNILEEGKIVDETVKITFVEGKNMRWIASTIAQSTDNTEDDVFNLLQDDEYIDSLIEKYWFLDDKIKDDDIYYPLEGYLYPDTYVLADKTVDVKTIFEKMLDKMESVLDDDELKNGITNSKYSVHEILSLASVVELEAKDDEDRAEVAGVFYNRLSRGMALQSDVTTYYASKVDMNERNLTQKELANNNPYNTRSSSMAGKLPIGPICMVGETSIDAVINPKKTSALFFVADKNGKVYFSKTNAEHEQKIEELKKQGLWYTYGD